MFGDKRLRELNIIRVGEVLPYTTLDEIGEKIVNSFGGAIRDYSLKQDKAQVAKEIDAFFLTMILNSEFQGHNLGITDANLKTTDPDEFYNAIIGGKNPKNHTAVVSIRKLSPEVIKSDEDYKTLVNRTVKVSLHEIGHNLGLTDHVRYVFVDGKLCPMSKGEYNKFGYNGYVRAVVDGRGEKFCDDCNRFLDKVYRR